MREITMGFFNYQKAYSKFNDDHFVTETIKRLQDFDEFHCLRDSSLLLAGKLSKIYGSAPEEYIKWMSVCNGGLLFDTELLSIDGMDKVIGIEFSTIEDYNTSEMLASVQLPEGYSVIAVRSYGDPICITKQDRKIYLWDCELGEFTDIWETFYDFLAEEVDTALELIANEDLEPIPLKLQESAE